MVLFQFGPISINSLEENNRGLRQESVICSQFFNGVDVAWPMTNQTGPNGFVD